MRIKTGTRFFALKLSLDFKLWASSTIIMSNFLRYKIPASFVAMLYDIMKMQHRGLKSSCADVKTCMSSSLRKFSQFRYSSLQMKRRLEGHITQTGQSRRNR